MAATERKALIISADKFEDSELLASMYRLQEAGFTVDVATPGKRKITGKHGYEVEADLSLDEVGDVGSCGYKALILPGGKAPGTLREMPKVLDVVRDFASAGLPVAAICHGPQILISAGLLRGKTATAAKSMQQELKDAGAEVRDEEVVVDGPFITSRRPADIPAFNREIMKKVAEMI